jgi:hypothetical protein
VREREIDNGVIQYVSPFWDDPVDRVGYRFVCGTCGWVSPIMSHGVGAERHADEHDCPAEALAGVPGGSPEEHPEEHNPGGGAAARSKGGEA